MKTLTAAQRAEIKAALASGASGKSLAAKYGVANSTITKIKNGTAAAPPSAPPGPALIAPPAHDDAPVPQLDDGVCAEIAEFAFWLVSLALGPGWELKGNEKHNFGRSLEGFIPNLPAVAVERIVFGVKWIRPVIEFGKIVKPRILLARTLDRRARELMALNPGIPYDVCMNAALTEHTNGGVPAAVPRAEAPAAPPAPPTPPVASTSAPASSTAEPPKISPETAALARQIREQNPSLAAEAALALAAEQVNANRKADRAAGSETYRPAFLGG